MSDATSGPSQSRTTRVGSYYFCIEGLPRGFTWQDLKDLIRKEASHGIWTEMYRHPDGTTGEIGYVRVQRLEEAANLYRYLVSGGRLQVHLFDTSKKVPEKINCTCNHGSCIATQRTQLAAINHLAASPSWMPLAPQACYAQPAVTYAGQPISQYTTAPGPPPMASYPTQSLEDSMSGLRIADRNPNPVSADFSALCLRLISLDPSEKAAATASLGQVLSRCTTQAQKQYIASMVTSYTEAYRAHISASHPIPQPVSQSVPRPTYTYGPDGYPINASCGVVLTESSSVFVSKLDFKATVKDIQDRFSKGELRPMKCILQKDQATGKSRGHAIVQYANAKDARKAVTMFDKQKFMGMEISVRLDKEKVAVNPPASSSSAGVSSYANSSTGRGKSSGGSTNGSSRSAVQSRANAGPIIANGSTIKS